MQKLRDRSRKMQSDADSEEVRHETISKTQAASRILDIVMTEYISSNSFLIVIRSLIVKIIDTYTVLMYV